jgi:hypothetical protein
VSAFEALVSLLEVLSVDECSALVMPVLRRHMQPFDLDGDMQRTLSRLLGNIVTRVRALALAFCPVQPARWQHLKLAAKVLHMLSRVRAALLGSLLSCFKMQRKPSRPLGGVVTRLRPRVRATP